MKTHPNPPAVNELIQWLVIVAIIVAALWGQY